jgi:hypothetical protein
VYKVRENANSYRCIIFRRTTDSTDTEVALAAVDESLLELCQIQPGICYQRWVEVLLAKTFTNQMQVIEQAPFYLKPCQQVVVGANLKPEAFDTLLLWQGSVSSMPLAKPTLKFHLTIPLLALE